MGSHFLKRLWLLAIAIFLSNALESTGYTQTQLDPLSPDITNCPSPNATPACSLLTLSQCLWLRDHGLCEAVGVGDIILYDGLWTKEELNLLPDDHLGRLAARRPPIYELSDQPTVFGRLNDAGAPLVGRDYYGSTSQSSRIVGVRKVTLERFRDDSPAEPESVTHEVMLSSIPRRSYFFRYDGTGWRVAGAAYDGYVCDDPHEVAWDYSWFCRILIDVGVRRDHPDIAFVPGPQQLDPLLTDISNCPSADATPACALLTLSQCLWLYRRDLCAAVGAEEIIFYDGSWKDDDLKGLPDDRRGRLMGRDPPIYEVADGPTAPGRLNDVGIPVLGKDYYRRSARPVRVAGVRGVTPRRYRFASPTYEVQLDSDPRTSYFFRWTEAGWRVAGVANEGVDCVDVYELQWDYWWFCKVLIQVGVRGDHPFSAN